jgi:hypothetical protein
MELKWGLSVNKWSDVKCSDVEWADVIHVKWFCFEVKCSEVKWLTVKFLGKKSDLILRVLDYIVTISFGYILYCVRFNLYCGCFNLFCSVWVFGNIYIYIYTSIYCIVYCLYWVFILFRLCIFILTYFVCTSVTTTATEWQINCS